MCFPISAKEQPEKQVLSGTFFGYVLCGGSIWKGDILVTDIGERENLEHVRNPRSHSQCQGGSHAREWRRIRFLSSQMDQSSWQEEITYSEHPPFFQDHPARGEELNDVLQGDSDGLQPLDPKRMASKPELISGVFLGDHIYHHAEPSVHVYVPHEGSIPISLGCIDVVRRTNTTIDGCIAGRSL